MHQNAKLEYKENDMVLHVENGTAYLIAAGLKSRAMGSDYTPMSLEKAPVNAAVHVECKLLMHVISSAAEAEPGGLCANCRMLIMLRTILWALRHLPAIIKSNSIQQLLLQRKP